MANTMLLDLLFEHGREWTENERKRKEAIKRRKQQPVMSKLYPTREDVYGGKNK